MRAWTGGREPEIAYLKRRRICDSTTSHAVETRALPICCAADIDRICEATNENQRVSLKK